MSDKCVFCRIVSGSEPEKIIYKDANVIAFFPRFMEVKAHTLVVHQRYNHPNFLRSKATNNEQTCTGNIRRFRPG